MKAKRYPWTRQEMLETQVHLASTYVGMPGYERQAIACCVLALELMIKPDSAFKRPAPAKRGRAGK